MIKSIIIPLFFITFVVIFVRGEPECPKNIKTSTTLPFKGDCKNFYICTPSGGKVGLSCLNGYNFNPETGLCEDETKYKCPYEGNDSLQTRFDVKERYPLNGTTDNGSGEDGDKHDPEILGRTFFNWFDFDDKAHHNDPLFPLVSISVIVEKFLRFLLWPLLIPLKGGLSICKFMTTLYNNLFCNCAKCPKCK